MVEFIFDINQTEIWLYSPFTTDLEPNGVSFGSKSQRHDFSVCLYSITPDASFYVNSLFMILLA